VYEVPSLSLSLSLSHREASRRTNTLGLSNALINSLHPPLRMMMFWFSIISAKLARPQQACRAKSGLTSLACEWWWVV
jgi:hypothetical protein